MRQLKESHSPLAGKRSAFDRQSAIMAGVAFYEALKRLPLCYDLRVSEHRKDLPLPSWWYIKHYFGGIKGYQRSIFYYVHAAPSIKALLLSTPQKPQKFTCLYCDRFVCTEKHRRICSRCKKLALFREEESGAWMNGEGVIEEAESLVD